jgi:hypothetical protein
MQKRNMISLILCIFLAVSCNSKEYDTPSNWERTETQAPLTTGRLFETSTQTPTKPAIAPTLTSTRTQIPITTNTATNSNIYKSTPVVECWNEQPIDLPEKYSGGTLVLEDVEGIILWNLRANTKRLIPRGDNASVSPDGKLLAYVNREYHVIVESAYSNEIADFPEEEGWMIPDYFFWLDNTHLWLSLAEIPEIVSPVLVINPFTGEKLEIPSDYPTIEPYAYGPSLSPGRFHYSLTSAVYTSDLGFVIYPGINDEYVYTSVLFDRKNGSSILEILDGGSYDYYPLLMSDNFHFILPSKLGIDKRPKEWFMIGLNGSTKQLSYFNDIYPYFKFEPLASISPDGRYLSFGLHTQEGEWDDPAQLVLLNLETLEVTYTCIPYLWNPPIWSPDSRYIAIGNENQNDTPVYLLDIEKRNYSILITGDRIVPKGWLVHPP